MKIERSDEKWECHECGKIKRVLVWIHLKNLCQHSVSLCPKCFEILRRELNIFKKKIT